MIFVKFFEVIKIILLKKLYYLNIVDSNVIFCFKLRVIKLEIFREIFNGKGYRCL